MECDYGDQFEFYREPEVMECSGCDREEFVEEGLEAPVGWYWHDALYTDSNGEDSILTIVACSPMCRTTIWNKQLPPNNKGH